jgi:8-oxo-dGTP pyrophosphatase MutT (NUDIX family)
MSDHIDFLNRTERDQTFPLVSPRDAATLILIDRTGAAPKVLLGRRHDGHEFLPGKYVFPGGRVEPDDSRLAAQMALDPQMEEQLTRKVEQPSPTLGRALALAAIRETFEETGLLLGTQSAAVAISEGPWASFLRCGFAPNLEATAFIGRAITPPGRPRRFDTRFFTADAGAVTYSVGGVVGPDAELVELVWVPIAEARDLDLPAITLVMLAELETRVAAGLGHELPVPFYFMQDKRFTRELL